MTLPAILVLPSTLQNRDLLKDLLLPLGREVRLLEDELALMAELAAAPFATDLGLLVLDGQLDEPDFYPLLNRVLAHEAGASLPLLWLAPGLGDEQRRLYEDLLLGVDVLPKPFSPETLLARAAACLARDELRRRIEARYPGADWGQTSREGLLGLGRLGEILYANRAACRLLRLPMDRLMGLYWQSLLETWNPALLAAEVPAITQALAQHSAIEIQDSPLWRVDGSSLAAQAALMPVAAEPVQILFAFKPLPTPVPAEEMHSAIGRVDLLTGLANRAAFEQALGAALAREASSPAVLVLDIDHLRHVNDTLGHALGDELLQRSAQRLREALAGSGLLARIAGDRFAVLLEKVSDYREAGLLAQKLKGQFRQPFLLAGHEVYGGVSTGLALYPSAGDTTRALLDNAALALDRAKALGRNAIQFYSAELNRHTIEQLERESALQRLLKLPSLPLVLRPWQGADGQPRFVSVALADSLRRSLPASPAELAEEQGLGDRLGRLLLLSTFAAPELLARIPAGLPVIVDLPASALRTPETLSRLWLMLETQSWPAARLILHLDLDAGDWAWLESPLQELMRWGVGLGLRLGRRGPALEPICRLPWQQLVLDPSFGSQLADTRVAQAALSLIDFGRKLNFAVLADGVSPDQAGPLFAQGLAACAGPEL